MSSNAHHCAHCFARTDFISTRSTYCPQCADVTDLTKQGEWAHYQTLDGQIADRRAIEMVKSKSKMKGERA